MSYFPSFSFVEKSFGGTLPHFCKNFFLLIWIFFVFLQTKMTQDSSRVDEPFNNNKALLLFRVTENPAKFYGDKHR